MLSALFMPASKSHALVLFQKEYKNLFSYIKSKVRCQELTEDLLQDLYLKLHHLSQKKELTNSKSYLISMARNLIIDNSRKPGHTTQTGQEQHIALVECDHANPEQQSIDKNYIELMAQTLSKLPIEKQNLLTLSRVHGWSNQQIANNKGKSLSWDEKNLAAYLLLCSEIVQEHEQNER